jgi:BirA family biotin operon repressor/biotin-[acetyl-CoA-carboxylase] ligase
MPECHSTNSFALDLCQQPPNPADGTVIITSNQISGRGQRGNEWMSEGGKNLTFSIIFKPHFLAIGDQFYLNVFASLAIRDYLTRQGCAAVRIKWPNDILVNDRKICGILIENQLSGVRIDATVVGIGLNINQEFFPAVKATSLAIIKSQPFELDVELELLLACIEARYLQLREGQLPALLREYLDSLYWINEKHFFENTKMGRFEGMITGIEKSGQLMVSVAGDELLFGVKELTYLQ